MHLSRIYKKQFEISFGQCICRAKFVSLKIYMYHLLKLREIDRVREIDRKKTGRHFSRVTTACFPTVKSKTNKFEHVWRAGQGRVRGKGGWGLEPCKGTPFALLVNRMTDRHHWKHYLLATSLAGDKHTDQTPQWQKEADHGSSPYRALVTATGFACDTQTSHMWQWQYLYSSIAESRRIGIIIR